MITRGVIEGFFGRTWSWAARDMFCRFLAEHGYDFYIYAPKADSVLRRRWRRDWPEAEQRELVALSARCRDRGLSFGVGLSPFELHMDFNAREVQQLERKVEAINRLNADILCVLFDDMRGDKANLAQIQAEIVAVIAEHSEAKRLIVCPSYYSEDPILDKVFSPRPPNYLEDLGRLLDPSIDVFWTGPRVCSEHFSDEAIQRVTQALQRPPFLWDNYPVNDGAKMCKRLHLKGFDQRSNLDGVIAGHAINPMNQPWLSRIPLATLPDLYRPDVSVNEATQRAARALCGPQLAAALIEDLERFQVQGLSQLDDAERATLIKKYRAFGDDPTAGEVVDWLEGRYAFDPACLTD